MWEAIDGQLVEQVGALGLLGAAMWAAHRVSKRSFSDAVALYKAAAADADARLEAERQAWQTEKAALLAQIQAAAADGERPD